MHFDQLNTTIDKKGDAMCIVETEALLSATSKEQINRFKQVPIPIRPIDLKSVDPNSINSEYE